MSARRMGHKRPAKKKPDFKTAVESTPNLTAAWQAGLQALRAEDRLHVTAEDTRMIRGSVDVDGALVKLQPNENRWDFAIGYQHSDRTEEVVYWAEMHTASDSQIGKVIAKAQWLRDWLRGDGKLLAAFERDIVWVSSGPTTFTGHSPRAKQMAAAGLRHVGSKLKILNKRG